MPVRIMIYHFFIDDAVKYGVDQAVILYHLSYWILHNEVNNVNYHEGHFWTYNSHSAFEKLFPFWSTKKIGRLLIKLEKEKIIKSGLFNKNTFDQTKWYTVINEEIMHKWKLDHLKMSDRLDKNGKCIGQICPIDGTDLGNRWDKNVQPIPHNKPNIKPYNKPTNQVKPIVYRTTRETSQINSPSEFIDWLTGCGVGKVLEEIIKSTDKQVIYRQMNLCLIELQPKTKSKFESMPFDQLIPAWIGSLLHLRDEIEKRGGLWSESPGWLIAKTLSETALIKGREYIQKYEKRLAKKRSIEENVKKQKEEQLSAEKLLNQKCQYWRDIPDKKNWLTSHLDNSSDGFFRSWIKENYIDKDINLNNLDEETIEQWMAPLIPDEELNATTD